jgi:hypothetical protein
MRHSEATCGNNQHRNYWSPALRNAGLLVRYWGLRFKEAKTRGDYQATIHRLLQSAQASDPCFVFPYLNESLPIHDICLHWKSAKKSLRQAQKSSKELRFQSYHNLLESYENDTDPSTQEESRRRAKIVRNTLRTEAIRANFRNIKLAATRYQDHHGGLRSIMVPVSPSSDTNPLKPSIFMMLFTAQRPAIFDGKLS